ncbi:alginate lyase family protein [Hymenobacter lucidus]|uniref:Alginate lyase family protein n=1 Tax=Hymenobacter lucidus TaxID=2880930 RepID=A0ABS8AXK7_9BACT|nr:alginate lyase family protein [Hymenobacter lucidus]MCB2410513.1 alginate lyase family protein [Hymenobacter lucidus]
MKLVSTRSRRSCLSLAAVLLFTAGCQKQEAAVPAAATATADSTITTFRHPGVVNSKASLDLVAAQANAGDATRTAGYNKVVDYMNQYAVPTSFPSVVYVVGSGGSPTEDQIRRDAILAYACALRWVKTGNATYANQSKQILNGYAYNFQRYSTSPKPDGSPTEFRQTYLEAAWVAPSFVAAGEIIRYYQVNGTGAGWSATDVSKFSDFLNNLKNNYVNNVPGAINDINNWQASYAYAKMALGVWFNSTAVYDSGYDYLFQILPQLFYSDGAVKEQRDRDCVHPQYTLTALTYAAETARIQGNTAIYEANGQQIKNGWNRYEDAAAGNYTRNCSGSQIFPGIETAYNYYGTSKLASLRDRQDPYGVSGDKTFLGFTSFTHRSIGR